MFARNFFAKNKHDFIAIFFIIFIVFAANAYNLIKLSDTNPLQQRSGLAVAKQEGKISGYNTIDPNDGFISQAVSKQASEQWLRGDIPYWNYYEGVGTPLAGEMQSAALSPFVLLLHFSNGLLIFHIILEVISGIATYLFLKQLGISITSALVGGITVALCGTFAWLANAVVNPIAFLPVLMLGFEIALNATVNKKRGGWVLVAIAIALSLYAGFPETAYINTLLAGGWALVRLFMLKKRALQIDYFIKLFKGCLAGLLLASPILAAFLGYLPYSDIGAHGNTFANASLGTNAIPPALFPYIYGPIFGFSSYDATGGLMGFWGSVGGYFTFSVFILAIFGLFSKLPRALKIFLFGWVAICAMKLFGVDIVTTFVNLIPTIKHAAFYRYVPPSIFFALVILAAFGLDSISSGIIKKKTLVKVFGGVTLLSVGLVYIAKNEAVKFSFAPHYKIWALCSVLLAFGVIVLLLAATTIVQQRYVRSLIASIVIGECILLFIIPQFSLPKVTTNTEPVKYLQQNIGMQRFYTFGPIEPNYGSYFDIASINQNDLPVPKKWANYIEKNLDTNTNPLLFVGYFRADPKGRSAEAEFFQHFSNYQKVGVKYVVTRPAQLKLQQAGAYNLKQVYKNATLEIYELPNPSPYFVAQSDACSISAKTRSVIKLECKKATTLVRKELNLPGWEASVSGKNSSISENDNLFQAVSVPAGKSTVKFTYAPPFIGLAYAGFVLALILIGLLWIPPRLLNSNEKLQHFVQL
jgi:hypothetical protein